MQHKTVKKKAPDTATNTAEENGVPKAAPKNKTTKCQWAEEYLSNKYEFRFNEIKCNCEWRNLGNSGKWNTLIKYKLNSIKRELDSSGNDIKRDAILQIIESDFSPQVNPIKDYFEHLQPWVVGMPDHITELCNTVTVKNSERWNEYFKKWMVAVVANIFINEYCANHVCLVITGKQGRRKSTWLNHLCPKSLKRYLYIGKIDPNSKDSLARLADYLFINIDDQLRQLNMKDENDLKSLITVDFISFRRPYDPFDTEYPHLASFMGSVNGNNFLTDPTGSRRFMAFEATSIDINKAKSLNMDLVYAQAYALYTSGQFCYWFTEEEGDDFTKNNEAFQVVSEEEQQVLQYFCKPATRPEASHFYQCSTIKSKLEEWTKLRFNTKKLGEALHKLGYEKWQKTDHNQTKWVYSIIELNHDQIRESDKQHPHFEYMSFDIKELREKLSEAVSEQNYEKAAKIKTALEIKLSEHKEPVQEEMQYSAETKDDLPF